jgi:probable selenium-dependent hydroxylase accessory protein YqeC
MNESQYGNLLKESLGLGERENISLVGAGGKTTLMYLLGKALSANGYRVITTTTTKILEPEPDDTPYLSLGESHETILTKVDHHGHVTVASRRLASGKLKGIPPQQVDELWKSGRADYLIVEADGAARKPLKAPAPYEPVIPVSTGVVITLVGVDGFNAQLSEETVFRSDIFSRLTGLSQGEKITFEAISVLFTHPNGLVRGAPSSARIVPFVNKVDLNKGLRKARQFARLILDSRDPRIDRVVLGQVQSDPPIVEVICRKVAKF